MTAHKPLPVDLIYALLADYKKPEDLIGEEGLLKQLTKALVEREELFNQWLLRMSRCLGSSGG